MTEQRAKRILELERIEKMVKWDKENPRPKELDYAKMVEIALDDPAWIKRCKKISHDKNRYTSDVFDVEESAEVVKLNKPAEDHSKKREEYLEKLKAEDRLTLISMLKSK